MKISQFRRLSAAALGALARLLDRQRSRADSAGQSSGGRYEGREVRTPADPTLPAL